MGNFNVIPVIFNNTPNSFNGLVPLSLREKWRNEKTGNVPFFGDNPNRLVTTSPWFRKIKYDMKETKEYRLMRGICENDLNLVKESLDSGLDVNSVLEEDRGLSALSMAASLNRPEILKYLILRGSSLENRDKF